MERIENWDTIEAKGMEDFKALPIGTYECVIKDARINHNEESGKDTFKVSIDIASGEYKDYFQKRYENNTNPIRKWDNNAVRYLAYTGDNVNYFKGFITCVENSNVGYKWDWDETKLKGKKICGVFQYEEYEKQDGTKAVKVRLNKFRSLDKMKDIEVSDSVRLLSGSYMTINDYNKKRENTSINTANDIFDDDVEIPDSELPF
jgi:hypothetical protein